LQVSGIFVEPTMKKGTLPGTITYPPLEEENIFNRIGGKGYVGSLAGRSSRRKNDTVLEKRMLLFQKPCWNLAKHPPLKVEALSKFLPLEK